MEVKKIKMDIEEIKNLTNIGEEIQTESPVIIPNNFEEMKQPEIVKMNNMIGFDLITKSDNGERVILHVQSWIVMGIIFL